MFLFIKLSTFKLLKMRVCVCMQHVTRFSILSCSGTSDDDIVVVVRGIVMDRRREPSILGKLCY